MVQIEILNKIADFTDKSLLIETMKRYDISAVIHFAGLKSVGESVSEPLKYYSNIVQSIHKLTCLDISVLEFNVIHDSQNCLLYNMTKSETASSPCLKQRTGVIWAVLVKYIFCEQKTLSVYY